MRSGSFRSMQRHLRGTSSISCMCIFADSMSVYIGYARASDIRVDIQVYIPIRGRKTEPYAKGKMSETSVKNEIISVFGVAENFCMLSIIPCRGLILVSTVFGTVSSLHLISDFYTCKKTRCREGVAEDCCMLSTISCSGFLYLQFLVRCHPYILFHF